MKLRLLSSVLFAIVFLGTITSLTGSAIAGIDRNEGAAIDDYPK